MHRFVRKLVDFWSFLAIKITIEGLHWYRCTLFSNSATCTLFLLTDLFHTDEAKYFRFLLLWHSRSLPKRMLIWQLLRLVLLMIRSLFHGFTLFFSPVSMRILLSSLFMTENLEDEHNSDILSLWKQAGLGGARDATNVISSSGLLASVITTIGEEHMDALGGSLESIAMAKSGIVKHNRPVRLFLLLICMSVCNYLYVRLNVFQKL